MLETNDHHGYAAKLMDEVTHYLSQVLHIGLHIQPFSRGSKLPVYISRNYEMYEARVFGEICLLITPARERQTPKDVAKHISFIAAETGLIVIYVAAALNSRDRSRLIEQGISFVVPGNQLYLPSLAMDLREHFRTKKSRDNESLSPGAQALLFHYILRRNEDAHTPSVFAKDLKYTAMTIGRAFDDLEDLGLVETQKYGRERRLQFVHDRRETFERVRSQLRTPVKGTRYLIGDIEFVRDVKIAGESALAERTNLAWPRLRTYALAASAWKGVTSILRVEEVPPEHAEFAVETWCYDPAGLSDGECVDPLSLYAQFHRHSDERVSIAAEELLESVKW